MTAKVINDPAALGWEFDPDTGRWTWGGSDGGSNGGGGTPFPEAPLDGNQYGRQDAGWTEIVHPDGGLAEVTTANVLLENPTRLPGGMVNQQDANSYIAESLDKLIDEDGNVIKGGIEEAPRDGSIYGRKDEDWVVVPTAGGGGGDVDLSAYYTAAQCDSKYEPKFVKNTAFNKNFGSSNGTVAQGDHNHTGVYQPAGSYAASNHNHSGVYQPAGSYAASNHNHNGVYQPVGNYALVGTSYTKAESDGKYALKGAGGGSTDTLDDVCQRGATTPTSPSASNWWSRSNTYTLGGINGKTARIICYDGKFVFYDKDGAASGVELSPGGNVQGQSFTSRTLGKNLITVYGNAIANKDAAGIYFTDSNAGVKSVLPARGNDFALVDNQVSLGNPSYGFSSVWAHNSYNRQRVMQNGDEAVLSVNDLIDVMKDLRAATKEEKTVAGLRDSIGNCVGGIVERLEAIQASAAESRQEEINFGNNAEPLTQILKTEE